MPPITLLQNDSLNYDQYLPLILYIRLALFTIKNNVLFCIPLFSKYIRLLEIYNKPGNKSCFFGKNKRKIFCVKKQKTRAGLALLPTGYCLKNQTPVLPERLTGVLIIR